MHTCSLMGCVVMVNIFFQRCLLVWTLLLILLLGICHSETKAKTWNLLHTKPFYVDSFYSTAFPLSWFYALWLKSTFDLCYMCMEWVVVQTKPSPLESRATESARCRLASRDSCMRDVVTFVYCRDAAALPGKWNWVQLYYLAHGRDGVIQREDCGGETQNEQFCIHDVISRKTKRRNISHYILRNSLRKVMSAIYVNLIRVLQLGFQWLVGKPGRVSDWKSWGWWEMKTTFHPFWLSNIHPVLAGNMDLAGEDRLWACTCLATCRNNILLSLLPCPARVIPILCNDPPPSRFSMLTWQLPGVAFPV